jgi:beta-lactamase superfamily II metal-dependent hydrolase
MGLNLIAALALFAVGGVSSPPAQRGVDFYFVDVEGGAATLIVSPSGESTLIDCGAPGPRDAGRIYKAAQAAGLKAIDNLLITHWHSDHFGGTPDLARLIPIRHFYNRGMPAPGFNDEPKLDAQMLKGYKDASKGKSVGLKPGDSIPIKQTAGTPLLHILTVCSSTRFLPDSPSAPKNPIADENLPMDPDPSDNAKSAGFLLSYGNFRFLDLGDLTWNMEYKLVAPTNKIGWIDVFQSSHHGLEISNNPVLIKSVNPRVAVFNNGPHKGGHPDVVNTLRNLPEIKAIYQVHKNLGVPTADNTEPSNIANSTETETCKGEYIKLSVAPDGKSYTVTVGSKGKPRRFETRTAAK